MKQKLLTFFAALVCATSMGAAPAVAVNGKLPNAFSVSDTKVVYFSQGNLRATTSDLGAHWTWSFAEHQYDYIGNAAANNAVNGNGTVSANGSVDSFGWSTAATYYGIHNSNWSSVYFGDFVDWGTNPITNGGNTANAWRTLTKDEWEYLVNTRTTTSEVRYAKAIVNGINGLIILPDDWSTSYYALSNTNNKNAAYTSNEISSTDWTNLLEAYGAVFLSNAGNRYGNWVTNLGAFGDYWSATLTDESYAYLLCIRENSAGRGSFGREHSSSVRLVSEKRYSASVTSAPSAISSLIYNGSAQALVNAGTASGGTMNYSLDNSSWSTSIPTATDADDYTVYYKVVGDASHSDFAPLSNTVAVTISKAASSITSTPTAQSLTYNGSAQTLVNAGTASGGTMNYSLDNSSWSTSIPTATNADDYTVYYKVVGDANHADYTPSPNTVAVTINKATPTVTAPTAKSLTYSGSAQALVNAGSTTGGTLQYSLTSGSGYGNAIPTQTNADTYTVYYKVNGNDNYNAVAEASVSVTIAKADVTLTAPTAITGLTYTGAAQTLVNAGSATGGELQYKLGAGAYSTSLPQATAADTYTVYYKVVGDANHNNVAETSFTVTIGGPTSLVLTAHQDPQHPSDYYSTFYHSAIKYSLPAGIEAYVAIRTGDALNLTKIAEAGDVLPANNAVILKANTASITLTPSEETAVSVDANDLQGTDAAITNPNYGHVYVLSAADGEVGFYKLSSGATIPAHKAYITIAGSLDAPRRLRFVFDATTDIESIQSSAVSIQKVLRDGQLVIIRNGVEYNANGQTIK